MVQAGTQARSNPDVVETVAWVTAGNLGKSKYARGTCYKPRVMSIGGRLGYDDDGETPNTQLVYHAYDGPPMP
jgi:hypothetical protein